MREKSFSLLWYLAVSCMVAVVFAVHWGGPAFGGEEGNLKEILRDHLYIARTYENFQIKNDQLFARELHQDFYESRAYQPAWVNENGLRSAGAILFSVLADAESEGLNPYDYHYSSLVGIWMAMHRRSGEGIDPDLLVHYDLLLTDAFFRYASDLYTGRLDPETLGRRYVDFSRSEELLMFLEHSLAVDNPALVFEDLIPQHPGYHTMRDALASYREVFAEGGWPRIPPGPVLKEGDRWENLYTVYRRLAQEPGFDDLKPGEADFFDASLSEAVRQFQDRYGLDVSGHLDPATRKEMNIPAEERMRQIILNIERWRWLPQNLGKKYVLVNLPAFELQVVEEGETIMEMKAVVGREQRQTPVFSDRITHLVFCPRWYIPTSIAVQDHLPRVKENPEYLAESRIRVYKRTENGFEEQDRDTIDWDQVKAENFNYYFWQDSGPWNALGNVIFKFPNRYNVYLHDTPDQQLFDERVRSFSSGCIRIEKPMELAMYLLSPNADWTRERMHSTIEEGRERTVFLKEPVPIHLLYWTAWADEEGRLHFRKDIYDRDQRVSQALFR